jgi:hypothetical protein
MTPAQHQQAIARAGDVAMDSAVRKLDSATADAVKVRHEFSGLSDRCAASRNSLSNCTGRDCWPCWWVC